MPTFILNGPTTAIFLTGNPSYYLGGNITHNLMSSIGP